MKIQKKCSSYMKYTNPSTSFLARIPAVIFLLVFLFCMAVLLIAQYVSPELSRVGIEYVREKLIHTTGAFLLITVVFAGVRYLFENKRESFFFSILGVLLGFSLFADFIKQEITYFTSVYQPVAQLLLFVAALISYALFLYTYAGFYPMSTNILIKSMKRQLAFNSQSNRGWIKSEQHYPLWVARMESVPKDIDYIASSKTVLLNDVIQHFLKHAPKMRDKQQVLILLGKFASGKSVALGECVSERLYGSICHTGSIPIFVNLRAWLSEKEPAVIRTAGARGISLEDYNDLMARLCKMIAATTNQKEVGNTLVDLLFSLHEEHRLVYVFDGLDELLQQMSIQQSASREQIVRDISSFIFCFSNGNPYILSLNEFSGAFTNRSLLIHGDMCDYQLFAIKGVALEDGDDSWKKTYATSVALYQLAEIASTKGDHVTAYNLLGDYVIRQLKSRLVNPDEAIRCLAYMDNITRDTISDAMASAKDGRHLHKLMDPYAPLVVRMKAMDVESMMTLENAHILYRVDQSFSVAHVLILEYFIARYMMHAQDEDSGQQSADAAPSLAALLLGDYTDDKKETPLVLAATHIADAFVMALKQIAIDGDSQQMLRFSTCIDKVIEVIAGTKHMPKFLLLLSSTGKDSPLKKMPLKEATNKLILKAAASTALSLSEQAAIIGICKGEDLNSMLLKRALEAPWTYQKVKCEILKEYLPSDTKEKVKSISKALDSKREQEETV